MVNGTAIRLLTTNHILKNTHTHTHTQHKPKRTWNGNFDEGRDDLLLGVIEGLVAGALLLGQRVPGLLADVTRLAPQRRQGGAW